MRAPVCLKINSSLTSPVLASEIHSCRITTTVRSGEIK